MRMLKTLLAAAAITAAQPAQAQDTMTPEQMADEMCVLAARQLDAEQQEAFCHALRADQLNVADALERVNRALEVIPAPEPTNAMLLMMKGGILAHLDDDAQASKVFAEAIDTFPGFPPLYLSAIETLAYTSHADDAADYWIEFAEVLPPLAGQIPGHVMTSIVAKLENDSDYARLEALVGALDGIDYRPDNPVARSSLAQMVVNLSFGRWDMEGAREALADVIAPDAMQFLLISGDYRELWDDIAWNDPARRADVLAYWLTELAEAANGSRAMGGDYLRLAVGHVDPAALVETYRPQLLRAFAASDDPDTLYDYAYWVSPIANAQWISGDLQGAQETYQAAIDALTRLKNPARYNASANYAKMLVDTGQSEEGLAMMDETIAELQAMDQSNLALLPMHAVRSRALHDLGRDEEAEAALRIVTDNAVANPALALTTMMFFGREREARRLLVDRLESDINYRGALAMLQPPTAFYVTDAERANDDLLAVLRGDRRVRRAAERRGRILDLEPIALDDFVPPPIR